MAFKRFNQRQWLALPLIAALGAMTGCKEAPKPEPDEVVIPETKKEIPDLLSELNLFSFSNGQIEYSPGIIPYELTIPFFSDYAVKKRAIYIPQGSTATWQGTWTLDFPPGTILIKNFLYPEDMREPDKDVRIIETRLIRKDDDGKWKAYPYKWNEEMTDATLHVQGDVQEISFVDTTGETQTATYLIPQRNQCLECHEIKNDEGERMLSLIGPRPMFLNKEVIWNGETINQLQLLFDEGFLAESIEISDADTATDFDAILTTGIANLSPEELNKAARDYLEINCANCHRPNGVSGITSQLFLNVENEDSFHLGVCKRPGSAGVGTGGHTFDIVPGNSDESILYYRIETEEVGAMMPALGRSLAHREGAELIRAWIDAMPPESCE